MMNAEKEPSPGRDYRQVLKSHKFWTGAVSQMPRTIPPFVGLRRVEVVGTELADSGLAAFSAGSCRTFFIINPTPDIRSRAEHFCDRWKKHRVYFDA